MIQPANHSFCLQWSGHLLALGKRTHVMGVLNVTPDSFSDGGRYLEFGKAVEHGLRMAEEGADILDVGGESTRPWSEGVSEQEEMDRVVPVIQALAGEIKIPISVDTLKAKVAEEALRAGASIINDVTALGHDPAMLSVAARGKVPVVLMHMKGSPRTMQDNPQYEDLLSEVAGFLKDAVEKAVEAGVRRDWIVVDPGIGFGKSFDHNLQLLRDLGRISALGCPLLVGTSRKAFLGRILGDAKADRDNATMATVAASVLNGAHIVRVHNVRMAVETVKVADAIRRGKVSSEQSKEEVRSKQ